MADNRVALDVLIDALDARLLALVRAELARPLAAAIAFAGRAGALSRAARVALGESVAATIARVFGPTPALVIASDGTPLTDYARLVRAGSRAASVLVLPDGGGRDAAWEQARTWVDPAGRQLSARIWSAGEDMRARVDTLLAHHLERGTPPADVADEVRRFLTARVGRRGALTVAGDFGQYAAWRLVVNESSRAFNVSVVQAANGGLVRYSVSTTHARSDTCDQHTRADVGFGPGVYRAGQGPVPPIHPLCRCVLARVDERKEA